MKINALILVAVLIAILAGCQGNSSDEITDAMNQWEQAWESRDTDKIMACYSDSRTDDEVLDTLRNGVIFKLHSVDNVVITGDTAKATVRVEFGWYEIGTNGIIESVDMGFKKINDKWRIN